VPPAANSYQERFDGGENLPPAAKVPTSGAIRVPDGRALAWAEYGSARGKPCILIPDIGSSRMAPAWLLHDSALPSAIRLLALDRPGTGASDPIGLGGQADPAEDLRRLVDTLAVGRVAVIGIGQGVDDAFAFTARYPRLVASVTAVSPRLLTSSPAKRSLRRPFTDRTDALASGVLRSWLSATGTHADLKKESTWAKALPAMAAESRAALGTRWKEEDFRAAIAADAGQSVRASSNAASRWPSTDWISNLSTDGVPVHIWHGENEGPTTVEHLQAAIGARPVWKVTAVAGPTAILGRWPQILSAAGGSFGNANTAA